MASGKTGRTQKTTMKEENDRGNPEKTPEVKEMVVVRGQEGFEVKKGFGHIASGCPVSQRPYMGNPVRQLGTTPEGETSIQTGIEDLNINSVAAFNVINKMVVDQKTEDKSF